MASFITDALDSIDNAVAAYAQTVFQSVSSEVNTALVAGGLVGLAMIAINSVMAFTTVSMRSYVTWSVRYIIVVMVATSWTQFEPIYNIITNVPQSFGGALLSAAGVSGGSTDSLNGIMDRMITTILDLSDTMNSESGWFGISLSAVLLMVLAAGMGFVAVAVSAMGKIGLALFVSVAPLGIGALAFNSTRQLFAPWCRATVGVALIPLVLAGIMGAVIGVGNQFMDEAEGATSLSEVAGFVIVTLAAIFMMKNVPAYATSLAGSVVTVGTGVADAIRTAAGFGKAGAAVGRGAVGAAHRMADGRDAATIARDEGKSRTAQTAAFIAHASRLSRERMSTSERNRAAEARRAGKDKKSS